MIARRYFAADGNAYASFDEMIDATLRYAAERDAREVARQAAATERRGKAKRRSIRQRYGHPRPVSLLRTRRGTRRDA